MATKQAAGERAGERGPVDHHRRAQLLEAADAHFRRYGFNKTTVADLAGAVGVSPAYVYRFFESKQAIGEAVCALTLSRITKALHEVEGAPRSASERLRQVYRTLVDKGFELYFAERKLHDIVVSAVEGEWCAPTEYKAELHAIVRRLLDAGRAAGEFERRTPVADAATAILSTMLPFAHPVMLEQSERADLANEADLVAALVLRSLAP